MLYTAERKCCKLVTAKTCAYLYCRKLVTIEGCVSIVFIFWLFCILVIAKDLFIIYLACVAHVVGSLFAAHWKIYIDFKTSTINFYFVEKK